MKKIKWMLLVILLCSSLFPAQAMGGEKTLKMSTTTSTQASGLLDLLLPEFTRDTGVRVKVIAKGTGAAIRDGIDGNVDVIFVHAKNREEKFVSDGYGSRRYAVMHNDFVILGPSADPAAVKGCSSAVTALTQIAGKKALFVSRGDDSGTHSKEQALWQASGLPLQKKSITVVKKPFLNALWFFNTITLLILYNTHSNILAAFNHCFRNVCLLKQVHYNFLSA